MNDEMIPIICTLLIDDPELIRPFLDNLTNKNIDFLRRKIPFEDIEELSDVGGEKKIKDAFKQISEDRFWEIFQKFAPNEIPNLLAQFSEKFLKTLFEKIPTEAWVTWTDSCLKRNPIESLKNLPDDMKLYAIYNILLEQGDSIENDDKQKLMNAFREAWFYFDRTQIKEYPPEMARGLPSFVKDTLKNDPPWSSSNTDLEGHWKVHQLGDWKNQMRRNWELEPAYVKEDVKISNKIKKLYSETRQSYIYGQFKSSIALSRTVIEVALKEKAELSVYDRSWTAGKTLTKFLEKGQINKEIYDIADDVVVRADEILHRGANITEEETLYFLNKTKDFIELFYHYKIA